MNNVVDISDLPEHASASVKSFVSIIREGYHTQHGSLQEWKRTADAIIKRSPAMYFALCVGVGSLMRTAFKDIPGCVLHLKGNSTTGKTIALQTILSLRANPGDMTWCFDTLSTLKWYTIAADHNFLCLDDVHAAIMPDKGGCKSVPVSYFKAFSEPDNATHTTIISTSELPLDVLSHHSVCGYEIDVSKFPFWPTPPDVSPWWMDTYVSELKVNYGHVCDRVHNNISKDYVQWLKLKTSIENQLPTKLQPSRKAVLLLACLGREWLKSSMGLYLPEFLVYDSLSNSRN